MTLATVPAYDPDQIEECRGHAVVVGASMAGLFATRVLIDRFETVTLVEKDLLPDDVAVRSGTPQGRHIHAFTSTRCRPTAGVGTRTSSGSPTD